MKKIFVKAYCFIRRGCQILVNKGFDRVKNEIFYRLVGGTVEFNETAEEAMRREIEEELDSQLKNFKFIRVIENRFIFNGKNGHEIDFLYKADLVNKKIYQREITYFFDHGKKHSAEWISIKDILERKVIMYPLLDYKKIL